MDALSHQIQKIEAAETAYGLAFIWFCTDKSNPYTRERLNDAHAMQSLLLQAKAIINKPIKTQTHETH